MLKQLMQLFSRPTERSDVPTHLHVYTNTSCQLSCHMCYGHSPLLKQNLRKKEQMAGGGKEMDFDTFKYILNFLPTVQDLTFSGWGEPLVNPDLFKMIFYAHTERRAKSTVITNGLLLDARMEEVLSTPIHKLIISINGYSPSSYSRLTGMVPEVFGSVYRQVKYLIAQKRARNSLMPVWLSIVVDTDSVVEIPQMLSLANELQVDGLQLVNYTSADPNQLSDRTLTQARPNLIRQLEQFQQEKHPFLVEWPVIMLNGPKKTGNCSDPYQTIAVDGDCNISACSRWLLFDGRMAKVWESDFWHNEKISWLREAHSPDSKPDNLPRPCQYCPNNCTS